MTIVGRGDGGESWQFTYAPEPIRVFEGEDVFKLIGVACAALCDGDPSTNPPEPIATVWAG